MRLLYYILWLPIIGFVIWQLVVLSSPPGEALSVSMTAQFYDGFGGWIDAQIGPYIERQVWHELLARSKLETAEEVFEFGAGVGTLAVKLLSDYLPASSHYQGVEISPIRVAQSTAALKAAG